MLAEPKTGPGTHSERAAGGSERKGRRRPEKRKEDGRLGEREDGTGNREEGPDRDGPDYMYSWRKEGIVRAERGELGG